MKSQAIRSVGVIGAGIMGAGIAAANLKRELGVERIGNHTSFDVEIGVD